jgi:hypothetical protein
MLPCAVQNFPLLLPAHVVACGPVLALRVHHRELPAGLGPRLPRVAGIRIAVENGFDDRVGREARAQQRERLRTVAHVHDRLRRGDADARLGPEHAVADGKHARLHGGADFARVRVVAEDGKRAGAGGIGLLPVEEGAEEREYENGA